MQPVTDSVRQGIILFWLTGILFPLVVWLVAADITGFQ